MNLAEAVEASSYKAAISKRFSLAAYYVTAYEEERLGVCLLSNYLGEHIICGSLRSKYCPIPMDVRIHAHLPLSQLTTTVRATLEGEEGQWEPATVPNFRLEDGLDGASS